MNNRTVAQKLRVQDQDAAKPSGPLTNQQIFAAVGEWMAERRSLLHEFATQHCDVFPMKAGFNRQRQIPVIELKVLPCKQLAIEEIGKGLPTKFLDLVPQLETIYNNYQMQGKIQPGAQATVVVQIKCGHITRMVSVHLLGFALGDDGPEVHDFEHWRQELA
jgi:hypothetical protein